MVISMLSVEQIRELIRTEQVWKFYHDKAWAKLSRRVRSEQHNECYYCKLNGRYSPSVLTHHRYPLKKYPEFAYKRYYTDALGHKHINLVGVCFACHEEQEGRGAFAVQKHFTNVERW